MRDYTDIIRMACDTLVVAGSTFCKDKKEAYQRFIKSEENEAAKWVLETICTNAEIAEKRKSPLCDDTGIPHVVLEVGPDCMVSGKLLEAIQEGIALGLRKLPGRPMAVRGDDYVRLEQSQGMYDNPDDLKIAPIMIRNVEDNILRLNILMLGGGPAIRGKTYRVFHKHNAENVINEIVSWATEGIRMLGCTPSTIAVGVGRSQYEATSLMMQAMIEGNYNVQSKLEKEITKRINQSGTGPLGLGGGTSVLATFMKVGPQRASGVRIVSVRPCCCFEPRIASVILEDKRVETLENN